MTNAIETGYQIEHLSKQELSRLRKMILGYGNFKRVGINSGLHLNTFRNIIDRGYGTPTSVQKIRERILSA